MRENRKPTPEYIEALKQLTPREIEVMDLVSKGFTNKEISNHLHISIKTVQKHRYNICVRLQLKGRNALLKWTLKHDYK